MKAFLALLLGTLAMTAAVAYGLASAPQWDGHRYGDYPRVRAVWLPEPPVLGPARRITAGFQDPGHRLREQDPESYCWNPATSGTQVRQRERDPHAHRCACHLVCQTGAAGEVTGEHEDATCAHYCVREACNCHVEDPCEMPQGAH